MLPSVTTPPRHASIRAAGSRSLADLVLTIPGRSSQSDSCCTRNVGWQQPGGGKCAHGSVCAAIGLPSAALSRSSAMTGPHGRAGGHAGQDDAVVRLVLTSASFRSGVIVMPPADSSVPAVVATSTLKPACSSSSFMTTTSFVSIRPRSLGSIHERRAAPLGRPGRRPERRSTNDSDEQREKESVLHEPHSL